MTTINALNALLRSAAAYGDIDAIAQYLHDGADINNTDFDGMSALHFACSSAQLHAVKILLEAGAQPNTYTKDGISPLHLSIAYQGQPTQQENSLAIVRHLIDAGADINHRNNFFGTALHIACYENRVDCFELLMEHGADTTIKDGTNRTVFDLTEYATIEQKIRAQKVEGKLEEIFETQDARAASNRQKTPSL